MPCCLVFVRELCPVTRHLFIDCEEQSNLLEPLSLQFLRGEYLRGDNALAITRTSTVQVLGIFTRRNKRRNGVDVCGEYNRRRIVSSGKDIETVFSKRERFNSISQIAQKRSKKLSCC